MSAFVTEEFKARAVSEARARGVSQARIDAFLSGDGRNPDGTADWHRLWNLAPDTLETRPGSSQYAGVVQNAAGQWVSVATGEVSRTYGHTSVSNPTPVFGQAERDAVAASLTDPWLADAVRRGRVSLAAAVDARNQSTPVLAVGSVTEVRAHQGAQLASFLASNPNDAPRASAALGFAVPSAPGQVPQLVTGLGGGGFSPIVVVGAALVAYLLLRRSR